MQGMPLIPPCLLLISLVIPGQSRNVPSGSDYQQGRTFTTLAEQSLLSPLNFDTSAETNNLARSTRSNNSSTPEFVETGVQDPFWFKKPTAPEVIIPIRTNSSTPEFAEAGVKDPFWFKKPTAPEVIIPIRTPGHNRPPEQGSPTLNTNTQSLAAPSRPSTSATRKPGQTHQQQSSVAEPASRPTSNRPSSPSLVIPPPKNELSTPSITFEFSDGPQQSVNREPSSSSTGAQTAGMKPPGHAARPHPGTQPFQIHSLQQSGINPVKVMPNLPSASAPGSATGPVVYPEFPLSNFSP